MEHYEITSLQNEIDKFARLDQGDEYGEYINWLIDCGCRWDIMSPAFGKAYAAELKRVLKNYKTNYVIDEVEDRPAPRKINILRYTGGDY